MGDLSPLEHKVQIIAKDLDTGFQVFSRYATLLSTLRGWSITLLVAYLGFIISSTSHRHLVLLPVGVFLFLFMYLEATYKADMDWVRTEICNVEKIFMELDSEKFNEQVAKYEFRDIKIQKSPPKKMQTIFGPFKYMIKPRVFTWYLLLFFLAWLSYEGVYFGKLSQ